MKDRVGGGGGEKKTHAFIKKRRAFPYEGKRNRHKVGISQPWRGQHKDYF